MRKPESIKDRHLGGTSDLTLLAPIKPGFVDSLEAVTYKSRIKRVLATLHGARALSHEHGHERLLSDAIERVGAIHSVRVAVLEPEDKVLLAVTFDGSWESYLRVLWQKVGTLLDLVFCGTVDHVNAFDSPFEDWADWVRRVQVETGYFYGPPESSARDLVYLRRLERLRARDGDDERVALRRQMPTAEQAADEVRRQAIDQPHRVAPLPSRVVYERWRSGAQGMVALHRLADLHVPGTPDGTVLRRAARDTLLEFVADIDAHTFPDQEIELRQRFGREVDWLFPPGAVPEQRRLPPPPTAAPVDNGVRRDIQGGILRSWSDITHGAALFLAFTDAASAAAFLLAMQPRMVRDLDAGTHAEHPVAAGSVVRNLAFTVEGLHALGVGETDVNLFPQDFRQGMKARAGSLGDVRNNHPRRWRLPRRWDAAAAADTGDAVELDTVHAVLQLRTRADDAAALAAFELSDRNHPLLPELAWLFTHHPGVRLLAVQPLRRHYRVRGGQTVVFDALGFDDGNGQPDIGNAALGLGSNRIHLGEVLLGHDNAADIAIDPADPAVPAPSQARLRWLHNGSFLVMRKYRVDVPLLHAAADATVAQAGTAGIGGVDRELVLAKMMGRSTDGRPLAAPGAPNLNAFDYRIDKEGKRCPLQAHIRRANPRNPPAQQPTGAREPRIVRRSMSYGPPPVEPVAGAGPDTAERGLLFMAYNASIGEQFEVVQRWLAGGNSTGGHSGQGCPFVGVPESGHRRSYRFEHTDGGTSHVLRVELDGADTVFDEPPALARLEWGMYLFTPSFAALGAIAARAQAVASGARRSLPWSAAEGAARIAALPGGGAGSGGTATAALLAWKAALEDPESVDPFASASVWAAVREQHGGVLRTPYGVLVADRAQALHVLRTARQHYSVCGQMARMKLSFGPIFLGLDDGAEYRRLSAGVNGRIGAITAAEAFDIARGAAQAKLEAIRQHADSLASKGAAAQFETGFDAREVVDEVLANLCEAWFGLEPGPHFVRGGVDWNWQPGQQPSYPGHFTAISRYMFQPHPGPLVEEHGRLHGQWLQRAMVGFIQAHPGTTAPIAALVLADPAYHGNVQSQASTLVGVLMGFIPTVAGALQNAVREWLHGGDFWALRGHPDVRSTVPLPHARADALLHGALAVALQTRPVPPQLWRTALRADRLGTGAHAVDIVPGDVVVVGVGACTHQSLEDGAADGRIMFGGVRGANGPTHACPGYDAAIGTLLGTLTALLQAPVTLRPGSGATGLVMEGPTTLSAQADPAAEAAARAAGLDMADLAEVAAESAAGPSATSHLMLRRFETKEFLLGEAAFAARRRFGPTPGSRNGLVLAWGDSWLSYTARILGQPVRVGNDLRDCLETFGYDVPEDYCDWQIWRFLKTMADAPLRTAAGDFDGFYGLLHAYLQAGERPLAIVLSGGGNDSTESRLYELLVPRVAGTSALHPLKVPAHIAALRTQYEGILGHLQTVCNANGADPVPVLLHGYDYPIPDGNELFGYSEGWMKKPFEQRGYTDLGERRLAMRDLIEQLNTMLAGLPTGFPFVTWMKLTGRLEAQWAPLGADGWNDDLHPTSSGFELLAAEFDRVIQALP